MRKVLLITYYWPPSGGVGVQRWLKLCKYLPGFGWEPIVLTPENPDFALQDPSLLQQVPAEMEVLRLPIWEPYQLLNSVLGKKGTQLNAGMAFEEGSGGSLATVLRWLRGNLLVPDPRVFWVRPAARYAAAILKANGIEAIITTGPPHSMHLIGRQLKRKTGLPWLADFRDPWSEWEVLHRMHPSRPIFDLHRKLERKVLLEADAVTAASPAMAAQLNRLAGKEKVQTLLNGIDTKDAALLPSEPLKQNKFRLLYTGLLNEKREPRVLWQVLETLCRTQPGFADLFELVLAGNISAQVRENIGRLECLNQRTRFLPYQRHEQVFQLLSEAGLLLMLIDDDPAARVIIPAKLFEYLAARRPVLYIGDPVNDAGQILEKEGAGKGYAFSDSEGIQQCLLSLFREYQAKGYLYRPTRYESYTRDVQAGQVATLLNDMTA